MSKKYNYPKPKKPEFEHMGYTEWLDRVYLEGEQGRFGEVCTDGEFLWYKDEIICVRMIWTRDPIYCYLDDEGDSLQILLINHIIDDVEKYYHDSEHMLIAFSETENYTNIWDISKLAEKNFWDGIDRPVSVRVIHS
jgi:hypothetical protein